MKHLLLITLLAMSNISAMGTLILRDTTTPPLTNKGSELTYNEFDENFIKLYNVANDVVSGENVTAYDAGATYDQFSTDVYEQYASYGGRIWKAVYAGSPSSFSGQTPAEGTHWTQVTLAQLLPNIMTLAELASDTNARRGMCPQYCTEWQAFTNKDLNSNPVDIVGLGAPGAGKTIVPKFVLFALDAGGVAYDFDASGLWLSYSTLPAYPICYAARQSGINSATDFYSIGSVTEVGAEMKVNDKIQLNAVSDANVGTGTYYIKVIYQIENAPF